MQLRRGCGRLGRNLYDGNAGCQVNNFTTVIHMRFIHAALMTLVYSKFLVIKAVNVIPLSDPEVRHLPCGILIYARSQVKF